MSWSGIVLGWPAVLAAFGAYGVAFVTTHAWSGFIGAVIAAPFCVIVSGYPMFAAAGQVTLAANVLAAFLLYRGRREVAFAALVPFMVVSTALAVFAVRGITLVHG